MLEAIKAIAERSVLERVVLLVNHVVSAEPVAAQRLQAHAGRSVLLSFEGWPALLPPLGPIALRITPAGLLERLEGEPDLAADLRIAVDAANPARALARLVMGERPTVTVSGDAAFASDVDWLIENLRWDVQDDLARIVGDAPAREIGRLGAAVAGAVREAAKAISGFAGAASRPVAEAPPR